MNDISRFSERCFQSTLGQIFEDKLKGWASGDLSVENVPKIDQVEDIHQAGMELRIGTLHDRTDGMPMPVTKGVIEEMSPDSRISQCSVKAVIDAYKGSD